METSELALWGDAIGGILGTVVALGSVAFVYMAYREQLRSNANARQFQIEEILRRDIESLREEIENLHYTCEEAHDGSKIGVRYTGRAAIEVFAEKFAASKTHDRFVQDVFFEDLYFLIGRFDTVYSRIRRARVEEVIRHELMKDLIFLYTSRCFKGMSMIDTVSQVGKLKLTVNHTGMNPSIVLEAALRFHRQIATEMTERGV